MLSIEEYTANVEFIYVEGSQALGANREKARHEFRTWLSELIRKEREEAWDEAHREVKSLPHWWNTEDQYGEFDLQPLGPNETTEQSAFMEVSRVLSDNPYRKE